MSIALKLYEQLTDAGEDKQRARLIAEAFEALETRYPDFKDMATQGHVRESELRLMKEIQATKLEIKEVETRLTQAIHRQTLWVVVAIGGMTGLIRWLDLVMR